MPSKTPRHSLKQIDECAKACVLHTYKDEAPIDADTDLNVASAAPCDAPDQATLAKQLYEPICPWEIRILALSPGRLGEPLEAKIQLVTLARDGSVIFHDARIKSKYEALSYCWGPPVFECSVLCDSVDYPITRSLFQALQHLRLEDEVRYLWIDQLCINQHNLSERSAQVQKMLLIYQTASKVLVWLGDAGQYTGAVIYTNGNLNKRMHYEHKESAFTLRLHALQLCGHHFENFVHGLQDLLSRPWYNRLWILQEIWGAQDVEMYCGQSSLSMGDLERLSKALSEYTEGHHDPFLRVKRREFAEHKDELLTVLQRASASQCDDMRDRVYGVIAMSHQDLLFYSRERPGRDLPMSFAIDYSRNAIQVFQDVVKSYVKSAGLGIFLLFWGARRSLDQKTIFGGQVNQHRIPSWCPNFSVPWEFGRGRDMCRRLVQQVDSKGGYTFEKGRMDRNDVMSGLGSEIFRVRGIQLARVGDTEIMNHSPGTSFSTTIHLDKTKGPMQGLNEAWNYFEVEIDGTVIMKSDDIIVAVDGSLLLWILRKAIITVEFVGVAFIRAGLGIGTIPVGPFCRDILAKKIEWFEWFDIR